ncbi:hypothetical protein PsYK624_085560 [Phanerochaete sordida]|uniref:Sucraseferredoxin-like protein n=1 Tax=Phanerochaete sordida TaxID=48140 RepID=A0A9P3GD02_9APHY|nr:hypothetical protein PsYK624_085560 [Phanerochaete sordida]
MLRLPSSRPRAAATLRTCATPPRSRCLATDAAASIAGTVAYHRAYILLHTHVAPPAFPARVSSRLQRQLQLRTARWGGLVNFAWLPGTAGEGTGAEADAPEWERGEEEAYPATVYAQDRAPLDVPRLSMANLDDVAAALRAHVEDAPPAGLELSTQYPFALYVCTHGERDCRCGTTGQAVFDALQAEVARRGPECDIKVGGIGHVGGHKYAANVLVYPWGDWLGNVKPEDVPQLVETIIRTRTKLSFNSETSPPPFEASIWRGRMGLDKEEQLALIGKGVTPPVDGPLTPHASRS